jgi:hypothetical protein
LWFTTDYIGSGSKDINVVLTGAVGPAMGNQNENARFDKTACREHGYSPPDRAGRRLPGTAEGMVTFANGALFGNGSDAGRRRAKPPMPQYRFSHADAQAIAAYLESGAE